MSGIALLAHRSVAITCDEPEIVLRQGRETPLSQAIVGVVDTIVQGESVALTDPTRLAVVGLSRTGEQSTLDHVADRYHAKGPAGIDPVLFAKANQFFPVFQVGRTLNTTGPASTLFTSGRQSAESLYYAWLLLRRGHASHALALDYDLEAAQDGTKAAVITIRAILLGTLAEDEQRRSPCLESCRLGPYVPAGPDRSAALAAWRQSLCRDHSGAEWSADDLDPLWHAVDSAAAVASRVDHILPAGAGNIVTSAWHRPGSGERA
ncbi:hypothetical protein [Marinivivus vitaminiproducens]|uniref:hypothetical protein n=1 Tax=Marinivivus vitaminiproducens TaxID=3035935 RepID=UPI0027A4ECD0|nr:hypothetical protein P4R82_11630 [Geminicoccaceae bacterium SCSIO 64248]